MTLTHIWIFIICALLYLWMIPGRWRGAALVYGSVLAAFWLQPEVNIRWLDFSLTGILILLAVIVWWYSLPTESRIINKNDVVTLCVIAGIVMFLSLARHIPEIQALNITSRPPPTEHVMIVIMAAAVMLLLWWGYYARNRIFQRKKEGIKAQTGEILLPLYAVERGSGSEVIALLIALFILIKTDFIATALSAFLRTQAGQDPSVAAAIDIQWIGFSYVAFRLIHTLRDRQTGILPVMTLQEFLAYVLFFPAYTAGPIDRAERFLPEYRALPALQAWDSVRIFEASERIISGMVKKFVVADTLALFVLNDTTALQAQSSPALWLMLYGYAFRLYFDFSGYTDIAIGLGLLFGIRLPENFNAPYLKNNIAAFWQSWHITLSQWVRFYVYTPLSRALLRREKKLPSDVIMAICHLTTMLIIGAWHGITIPFLVWGAWHGIGLIVHKVWSDRTRRAYLQLKKMPRRHRMWTIAGTILTFHFVCLGWVWFSLSETAMALTVLRRLLFLE